MTRIILSIVGGLLFPMAYVAVVGLLSDFFPQYLPGRMNLFGRPTMGLIFAPVAVPVWIYSVIEHYNFFGLPYLFNSAFFRFVLFVGFDVTLYAGLIYAVLRYFRVFERKTPSTFDTPPPPPSEF